MNNLMMFEGYNVEVFEYEGKVLFNPYHVGVCLGIADVTVRRHIQDMNENQVINLKNSDLKMYDIHFRKLNNRGENFLTAEGVCALLSHAQSLTLSDKKSFQDWLINNNLITHEDVYTMMNARMIRKEINFLGQLEDALKPFGIKGQKQYRVLSYRIDYYIPSLNIAIEYDENNHGAYTYEQHEGRQSKIEQKLGCRFIRVSDKQTDAYNIGLVIKQIFNINTNN